MQENNSCGKFIYIGDVQGPEKVNDTCVKTMHAGTMYRGFTVNNYMDASFHSFYITDIVIYHSADKAMQLNQAKFRQNGSCGYLLKPEFMFREEFDPYDKNTLVGVEPLTLSIRVIGARHLSRSGRGISSPSVEIEVVGADYDSGSKLTTKTVSK
jgi:hypothetical protein